MSLEQWSGVSQVVQAALSAFTLMITLYIAYIVQSYTRRKDKFDMVRQRWGDQQAINLAMLSSNENLAAFEEMVYGKNNTAEISSARKFFLIFLTINNIQHFFFSYKNRLISKDELTMHCKPSARLLKNSERTVEYLLIERGYTSEFSEYLLALLADCDAVQPPKPE